MKYTTEGHWKGRSRGKKGMGNTGTSSKHNNTEIWTFTRAHFCLSYATFPSIKIWRKYLERILLCGKF